MLVMTFFCMPSDSITTILFISLHILSVPLLMRIFLSCSLTTPTLSPVHPITIGITSTLYLGGLALSSKVFTFYSLLGDSSHLGKPYLRDVLSFTPCTQIVALGLSAVDSFLILYSKYQLIFTCSFSTQLPVPT